MLRYETMYREVINAIEDWARNRQPEEVRRACCSIFPSWRVKREVEYGILQQNGWRQVTVQLQKEQYLIDIVYMLYDGVEYWAKGGDE